MKRCWSNWLTGCCLVLLCFVQAQLASADAVPALTVTPTTIRMGADFNGATLHIDGRVPAGSEVVLRFMGKPREEHMKQKGKVFGLVWMNRTPLTFKNVPSVCLIQVSKPFDQLGAAAGTFTLDRLRQMVKVEKASASDGDLDVPAELLRLKQREGLCRESVGGVRFGPATDGVQPFEADLKIPPVLSPGPYTTEVVALKEGRIVGQAAVPVAAQLSGLPAWLNNMAFKHGTLYGILAVVIAILGGLLIGLVFQGKGGGAH